MVTQPTPDIAKVRTTPATIEDSRGYITFRIFNGLALTIICVLTLYPFVNLVAKAFSAEAQIMAGRVNLVPRGFNTTTFEGVLADPLFWTNYRNTVVYTIVATAIAMFLTTMFAYALSKKFLKGRTFFIGLAVFTMFFNGGLIPNYLLISALGFKNTMWAIVIPMGLSIFNLLVMKAFFENFSQDLEEAAAIDGLSTYGILLRVVLPLSKAVIATMVLFYAVFFWNNWFQAFLYLDDRDLYPVTVYLRNLIAGATSAEAMGLDTAEIPSNVESVTMVLIIVPIICLYPFVQKYFVRGVMLGSVKG